MDVNPFLSTHTRSSNTYCTHSYDVRREVAALARTSAFLMAMPLVNWALNCGTQRLLPKAWWAVKDEKKNEVFNNSAPADNAKEGCNNTRAGSGGGRGRKSKQEEGDKFGFEEGEVSAGRKSHQEVHANSRCGLSVQRLHFHAFLCASIGVLCEDPNKWPQLAAFMVAACL